MLINGDVVDVLKWMPNVRACFFDPPDNIGLEYNGYQDNLSKREYILWLQEILSIAILKSDIVWLSYNPLWVVDVNHIVYNLIKYRHPSWQVKQLIWRFTFGEYNDNDFGSGYRPLLRLVKPGVKMRTHWIRVESKRMELGDPRAAGYRVPDDVWDFSRVVGNFPERREWHPTQHPDALMDRIVKASCEIAKTEVFFDGFAGTGTSLRVCKRAMVPCVSCELDPTYTTNIAKEQGVTIWPFDPLSDSLRTGWDSEVKSYSRS